jgi:hypothetical protein
MFARIVDVAKVVEGIHIQQILIPIRIILGTHKFGMVREVQLRAVLEIFRFIANAIYGEDIYTSGQYFKNISEGMGSNL